MFEGTSRSRSFSSVPDFDTPGCNIVTMIEKACSTNEEGFKQCDIMKEVSRRCPGKDIEILEQHKESTEEEVPSFTRRLAFFTPQREREGDYSLFEDIQSRVDKALQRAREMEQSLLGAVDRMVKELKEQPPINDVRREGKSQEEEWGNFYKRWGQDKKDEE